MSAMAGPPSRNLRLVVSAVALLLAACGGDSAVAPVPAKTPSVAAAVPTTIPLPSSTTRPPRPASISVLIIGDSVTYEIAPALAAALSTDDHVVFTNRTLIGFGLSRQSAFDWPVVFAEYLDEFDPDVVLFQTGTWDVTVETFLPPGGRDPHPGTPEWPAAYAVLAEEVVELLTAGGANLYWLSMLPGKIQAESDDLNDLARSVLVGREDAAFLDLSPVMADPAGRFMQNRIEVDGRVVPIRKVDQTHLCRDGAAIIAEAIVGVMAINDGVEVSDGWQDGPWRQDPLYDVDPCPEPSYTAEG